MEYDNFAEKTLYLNDQFERTQVEEFLKKHGIHLDQGLEYMMGVFDGDRLIATGGILGKTLRCLAIDTVYQGTGILNKVVSHLINVQYGRGNTHLFIYTKPESAQSFKYLGFYQIAEVPQKVVLLENRPNGLEEYLQKIRHEESVYMNEVHDGHMLKIALHEHQQMKTDGESQQLITLHTECTQKVSRQQPTVAAIVVNCNPFTLGHQYLIETAAHMSDLVHVFVVWEDQSVFPATVRYQLVLEGTRHLPNVIVHQGRDYIISNATFPSYFIKDASDVVTAHALLDLTLFSERIAPALGITRRFVGEEPYCPVTRTYNEVMQELLPKKGIEVTVIPRKRADNQTISASTVRMHLKNDELTKVQALVPPSTFDFLQTSAGQEIVKKIKQRHERH